MLEWIFPERTLMDSRWGRIVWIGSKDPHPFNRQFIYLARGANVKTPWRLVFIRRVGEGPCWAQKPRGPNIYGTGHCFTNVRKMEKNPPCNAEDNIARRTHRH